MANDYDTARVTSGSAGEFCGIPCKAESDLASCAYVCVWPVEFLRRRTKRQVRRYR